MIKHAFPVLILLITTAATTAATATSCVRTLCSEVAGQSALHFLLRLQNRVFVVPNQRLEMRILHAHVILDPAIVEDRPPKGRAPKVFQAGGREQILEMFRTEANRAQQGKA